MTAETGSGDPEQRPLFSKSVVVTRAARQAPQLVDALEERGAHAISIPVVDFTSPTDPAPADAAAQRLADYDWLVVTSPNGAELFCSMLVPGALGTVSVAAIGPGTAAALERVGARPDLVPERFVAEGLLEAFPDPQGTGGRVLLARAEQGRDVLPNGLREMGWEVDDVPVYRTVAATVTQAQRHELERADVVTFTSSSTVSNLVEQVGADALPSVVATISPVTSATARGFGLRVDVEASEHTIAGLVSALEGYFAGSDE